MADWDGALQAPQGMFRVIGEDELQTPAVRSWIGDYRSLASARRVANDHATPLNPVVVFDDQSKTQCLTWGDVEVDAEGIV
jgi:hypothetical protein